MKKIFALLLAIMIFISPIYADNKIERPNKHSSPKESIIDISTTLDEDVTVSDVLSFDDLVREYAENENTSKEEATKVLIQSLLFAEEGDFSDRRNKTYRRISKRILVKCWYRPSINFYCESAEESDGYSIKKIITSGINNKYYRKNKPFAGSIYANLENSDRIYWTVNGDFFDTGIRTVANTNTSDSAYKIEYTVKNSSGHYAYFYKEERIICGDF